MKKISMSSVLKMAAAFGLVLAFASCDNPSDTKETPPPAANTLPIEVKWGGAFGAEGSMAGSIKLVSAGGTELAASIHGEALNNAGTTETAAGSALVAEGGYFGSKSAIDYKMRAGDWGGVYAKFSPFDLTATGATQIKVALKGDIGGANYFALALQDSGPDQPKNFLVEGTETVDGDWTIYTVPLSIFDQIDLTDFVAVGLWHPQTTAAGGDNPSVVAISNLLVSVAFF